MFQNLEIYFSVIKYLIPTTGFEKMGSGATIFKTLVQVLLNLSVSS